MYYLTNGSNIISEYSKPTEMYVICTNSLLVSTHGVCAMFVLREGTTDQVNTHHSLLDLVVNCNSARP